MVGGGGVNLQQQRHAVVAGFGMSNRLETPALRFDTPSLVLNPPLTKQNLQNVLLCGRPQFNCSLQVWNALACQRSTITGMCNSSEALNPSWRNFQKPWLS